MGTGRLPIFVGRTGKTSGKQARGLAEKRKMDTKMKWTSTVLSAVPAFHFTEAFAAGNRLVKLQEDTIQHNPNNMGLCF